MKKHFFLLHLIIAFFCCSVFASASGTDPIKVGLRYGDSSIFSANLENAVGSGYAYGFFDDTRTFVPLGQTDQTTITMTAAGTIYFAGGSYSSGEMPDAKKLGAWHIQIDGFASYEAAAETAALHGGWPAWIQNSFVVRTGFYDTQAAAENAALETEGYAVQSSGTGVLVTVTGTAEALFEFDCGGVFHLGVCPIEYGQPTETWFKGYRYSGAFEYPRVTNGDLYVINVVAMEDYVKGVLPYEIGTTVPMAAMEAQAVCARTYAWNTRHASYGFDVCNTTDCQVYYGRGNGTRYPTVQTDEAVDHTAGQLLRYNGNVIGDAVYHAADGGATEDAINVWGTEIPYLHGKADPFETLAASSNYTYSVTYTASELTEILQRKGYSVGTVKNVYISELTPLGNVKRITFEGSRDSLTVKGETCRTIFYSSTYGKSVRSMRFGINGSRGENQTVYVNNSSTSLADLRTAHVISGSGTVSTLNGGSVYAISSSETATVGGITSAPTASAGDTFVIQGTGSGHNIGLSQLGARAMAEQGYSCEEILQFYYTGVTIE